jgi:transposase-like protein
MAKDRVTIAGELGKLITEAQPDVLRALLQKAIELLMNAEADVLCGAEYGKRSEERVNHRNGYRSRIFDSRVGTMELSIPTGGSLAKGGDCTIARTPLDWS